MVGRTHHPTPAVILFRQLKPDRASRILGTGYQHFVAFNHLEGLCKFSHGRLDLLAVVNPTGQRGLFLELILEAKKKFSPICVWVITNPKVDSTLRSIGFTPEVEMGFDGKPVEGLRWDK
jgi:hypothetical protein